MPPKNAGESSKAYRLRRQLANGQELKPTDALWLAGYEEEQAKHGNPKVQTQSYGASASGKRIKLDIQESAQSVGTGNAAVEAASAALMAKEEGRRLDSLTVNAVLALKEAVSTYKEICLSMRERMEILEGTHISMLESIRAHYLSTVDLEAELKAKDKGEEDSGMQAMVLSLVAKQLGIDVTGGTTKRNGAAAGVKK